MVPLDKRVKMNVQNIAFSSRVHIKDIKKHKNTEDCKKNNKQQNGEGKLKKALIAMGIIGAAGASVAVFLYKRNAKAAGKFAQKAADKVTTKIMLLPEKAESAVKPVKHKANKAAEQIQTEVIYLPETMEKSIVPVKEKAEIVGEQIKTRVENIQDAAQDIMQPVYKKTEEIIEPVNKNAWQETRETFQIRAESAMEEYNQRMNDKLKLSKRIKIIKNNNASNGYGFETSKIRKIQLSFLSNEQMNALNDKTLEHLLNNAYCNNGRLANMKFFKSLSPEQLIKMQESEEALQRFYRVVEDNACGYEFDCATRYLRQL